MRILVTGDLHLTDKPSDAYRFKALREIRKLMVHYDVSLLVILGDLTEAKNYHSAALVNAVVEEFHRFLKICPVVVLMGNHDYEAENVPFWGFLERLPGLTYVRVATDAKNLTLEPLRGLGGCLFLPHAHDWVRDWSGFQLRNYDLIFAHQTFDGARSETGRDLRGVPLDIFDQGTAIISGDVHVPQRLANVTYVGAPYTINFGSDYKPRVLVLGDVEDKSIPVPGPQKRLVPEGTNWKLGLQSLKPGDMAKVRVNYSPDGLHTWQDLKDQIRDYAEQHGIHVEKIEPILDNKRKSRTVKDRAPKSDAELLEQYAKHRRIEERMLKTGLWMIEHGSD